VQFSGGAVFASADVRDVALQSSNARIFAPAQVGWATAPVIVTFDVQSPANGGWWQLSLNRMTLVVTIEYNDVDLPDVGDKRSWIMTPDKCVSNTY
jgi:hypothetical protein